ncbi:MAG TPA: hypothetical protein VES60_00835 [Nakamurella sp.]|nr:hypothetical protein [Nakamurella sp.]
METTSDLLGDARPREDELAEMVATALHREVAVARWAVEPVAYEAGSPATAALLRVRGRTTDGEDWSVFLKVLQHPRHWAGLDRVPVDVRAEFTDSFPWRAELAAWDPEFLAALPEGLRVPRLYRLVELPDDRVAVWMQDVAVSDERWSVHRFARAARLLGRLATNRCDAALLASCGVPAGYGARKYVDGPVTGALFALRDSGVWRHPSLDTPLGRQVRGELLELAPQVPAILDLLDGLPQALPHGDASPQNLLVPRDDPDSLVAIDIAFQCPLAIGSDLGQLLVGLVHAGEMPVQQLPEIHAALAPAFTAGFAAGGGSVRLDDVRAAEIGNLVVRSAFTSIPFDRLDRTPAAEIASRLELSRFIVELAGQLPL